jgi:hypothetical protein
LWEKSFPRMRQEAVKFLSPCPADLHVGLFAKEVIQAIFIFQLLEHSAPNATRMQFYRPSLRPSSHVESQASLWAAFHLWYIFVASRNDCAWKATTGAAYKITSKSCLLC